MTSADSSLALRLNSNQSPRARCSPIDRDGKRLARLATVSSVVVDQHGDGPIEVDGVAAPGGGDDGGPMIDVLAVVELGEGRGVAGEGCWTLVDEAAVGTAERELAGGVSLDGVGAFVHKAVVV
jgi:hypothetical protein